MDLTERKRTRLPSRKPPRRTLKKWGQLHNNKSDRTQPRAILSSTRRTNTAIQIRRRSSHLTKLTGRAKVQRAQVWRLEQKRVKIRPEIWLSIAARVRE